MDFDPDFHNPFDNMLYAIRAYIKCQSPMCIKVIIGLFSTRTNSKLDDARDHRDEEIADVYPLAIITESRCR